MADSWESDPELAGNFFTPVPGRNVVVFADDGEKVQTKYGKKAVRFKLANGLEWTVGSFALIGPLSQAKKSHGTLVNRQLSFTKTGEGQAARYTDVKVE